MSYSSSRETAIIGTLTVLLFFVFYAMVMFVYGWFLMLFMGVLHHEISESIPAIGFWPSVVIGMLLSIVTSVFRSVSKKRL